MWSLTVLAESHDATLYSTGRNAAWVVEVMVVYLLLVVPVGPVDVVARARWRWRRPWFSSACSTSPPRSSCSITPSPRRGRRCGIDCPPNAFALGAHHAGVRRRTSSARCARCCRRWSSSASPSSWPSARIAPGRCCAGCSSRCSRWPSSVASHSRPTTRLAARVPTSASLDALGWIYVLSLGLIALSFAVGMLWRGLYATTALQRLTLGLRPQTTPQALRAALAEALEDPSLQIAYRLPDGARRLGERDGDPRRAAPRAAGSVPHRGQRERAADRRHRHRRLARAGPGAAAGGGVVRADGPRERPARTPG